MSINPNIPANFTPTLGQYKPLSPFRFWCQKVLPLVYDDSLSYYELLNKVINYLNMAMEDVETLHGDVDGLYQSYVQLQGYVNTYFSSLDVQEEINNKLDEMATDGSLTALLEPFLPDIIADWLNEHITPTSPAIDNTLSIAGAAGDAKKTGDAIRDLAENLGAMSAEDLNFGLWEVTDYTISNGVYNFRESRYDYSNTEYKHLEYILNGESALYVGGYSYGIGFALWGFFDANNNLLKYRLESPSDTYVNGEIVDVPENAYRIIVNIRWNNVGASPYYVMKYAHNQEDATMHINPDYIITEFNDFKSILHNGSLHHFNGTTSSNTAWEWREAALEGGEELIISGRNASNNYPLIAIYDSQNTAIYRIVADGSYYTVETNYKNRRIKVPDTARKIIVNGTSDSRTEIKILSQKKLSDMPIFGDLPGEININLVKQDTTFITGSVVRIDGNSGTNTYYCHCVMALTGNEELYISGRHFSRNYPLYIVYDENDNIMVIPEGVNDTNYENKFAKMPEGAAKIIVNGLIDQAPSIIKKLDSPSLSDYFDGYFNIYRGEKSINELLTNVPANAEFFSKAYAIMLHRIMTTYPTSKIICCTLQACERLTANQGFPDLNADKKTLNDYNNVIRNLAQAFGCTIVNHDQSGITYYNLSEYMYDYSSATGFGLHPNAAGMALLADQTVKDLQGYDLTGKTIGIFGDSISTYAGSGSTNNEYPGNTDVDSIEKTWFYKALITELGMTLFTNASGGGRSVSTIREGITNYPKSGYNQDAIDLLTVNNNKPDVIIIKLGVNDFGNVGAVSNRDLNGNYVRGGL